MLRIEYPPVQRTRRMRLAVLITRFFGPRQDQVASPAPSAANRAAAYDSQVLRHAVFTDSPDDVDWLLCAAIVTDVAKRCYCLERALAINPGNELARHVLDRLAPRNGR